jgi:hypothetical protein
MKAYFDASLTFALWIDPDNGSYGGGNPPNLGLT